jgi:hypothetical protein
MEQLLPMTVKALWGSLVLIASASSFAMDRSTDHGFSIVEEDDRFFFSYFDNREDILNWFQSRDMQGGGYSWQALTRASFELDPSPLAVDIEYDPEAFTFFAIVTSKSASDELRRRIERLVQDVDFRQKCAEKAAEGGYFE